MCGTGSNTCVENKGTSNKNPFPTKQFLNFDFLTGEDVRLAK